MADIKWIKLATDVFDDDKIKLIEKMPEGDTMLVIWLKLLTLAGKKNDGGMIYITRDIPYNPDLLADVMHRDNKIVMLAMNTFASFGMIEIVDDFITLVNWDKHQNVEGLDKIREQNRIRQQNYRAKQLEDKSNVTSRYSNAPDKSRIDKDKYINIYTHWNSKKNVVHHKTELFSKHVKKRHTEIIDIYGEELILQAIDNYDTIIGSEDYYFGHKWSFWDFIARGVDNFIPEADPFKNYKNRFNTNNNGVDTTPKFTFEVNEH